MKLSTIIWSVMFLLISQFVRSDSVTIPYSFSAGQSAASFEVNANFSALATGIIGNATDITNIETRVFGLESNGEIICTGLSFVQIIESDGTAICSSDLLGTGYSKRFPDILDNLVTLEIAGIAIIDPVLMVSGIGWDTERIAGFTGSGDPDDSSGLSMEHDFVIEADGVDAATLQTYFDDSVNNNRPMSVIVKDIAGTESFRVNLLEYDHSSYSSSIDGRTRFTFIQSTPADNVDYVVLDSLDPFGSNASNNPATDTLTEISGVIAASFYPVVAVDEVNRTMTLTYSIVEGAGIMTWLNTIRGGASDKRSGSVIQQENNLEVSRENYYGLFPISWEIFNGFGLNSKVEAQAVLSFDTHEPG